MNVVFLPVERNVIRSLFRIVIPFQYPHTHILHLNTGGGRKMENVLHLTEIPYIYEYLHMLQMQSTEFHLNFSHSGTVGIRFFFSSLVHLHTQFSLALTKMERNGMECINLMLF